MRFSFRLQSLLNWKRNLEESSQMRLAHRIRQLKTEDEEIQQLVRRRFENDQKLNEKMRRGIEIHEYFLYKTFGEESYNDLLRREGKKKQAEKEIEEEREDLIGLMKARKKLEKLKEKRFKIFIYQMEKMDQKNIDEIFVRQYPSTFEENLS